MEAISSESSNSPADCADATRLKQSICRRPRELPGPRCCRVSLPEYVEQAATARAISFAIVEEDALRLTHLSSYHDGEAPVALQHRKIKFVGLDGGVLCEWINY